MTPIFRLALSDPPRSLLKHSLWNSVVIYSSLGGSPTSFVLLPGFPLEGCWQTPILTFPLCQESLRENPITLPNVGYPLWSLYSSCDSRSLLEMYDSSWWFDNCASNLFSAFLHLKMLSCFLSRFLPWIVCGVLKPGCVDTVETYPLDCVWCAQVWLCGHSGGFSPGMCVLCSNLDV